MKIFFCFVALTSFTIRSLPQSNSQVQLKFGISRLFPSPAGKGYAYNIVDGGAGSVVIGGEFSHTLKNKKGSWQVGFTFQDSYNQPTPNKENIVMNNLDPNFELIFFGAPAKTVLYGGYEKFINRNYSRKFKNYFSVEGGLGLAFTLNSLKHWEISTNEKYLTKNGDTLQGTTYNFVSPSFPIGLAIYGGIRYNVTNKKGSEVFIVELMLNWGLSSFYNQAVDYTLDGMPKREILKENGNCLELNFVVPLFNFHSRSRIPD